MTALIESVFLVVGIGCLIQLYRDKRLVLHGQFSPSWTVNSHLEKKRALVSLLLLDYFSTVFAISVFSSSLSSTFRAKKVRNFLVFLGVSF